jgi:hypothetical protein
VTWKRYKLQAFEGSKEVSPPFVLEAPSPGAAVEIFLACHGMLGYSLIRLGKTDEEPNAEDVKAEILRWIPNIETQAEELDRWHHWEPWEEEA